MFTELGSAFTEFKYWFIRRNDNIFNYGPANTFLTREPQIDGYVIDEEEIADPVVKQDFEKFKSRPEFLVGGSIPLNTANAASNDRDTLVDIFENLLVGSILIKHLRTTNKNPDIAIPSAMRFIEWLRSTDFYTCPGSTRFHDAEPYGLLFHTLNVYSNIADLHNLKKFKRVDYASSTVVALMHDLTKIGNYESYMRNVKNESTGIWEQVPAFRWKDNPYPLGHGVASMYIASQFIRLSFEESLAIRWHMAEYRVAKQDEGELEEACERYPLVRMIQFADQLACTKF